MAKRSLMILTLAAIFCALPTSAIKVNYLGNSLTINLELDTFANVFKTQNIPYTHTASIMAGVPLQWWADHKNCFGSVCYPQSLSTDQWDILCMQPFGKQLTEDLTDGDRIIKETLTIRPNITFYLYTCWPWQNGFGEGDWTAKWNYTYKNNGSWEINSSHDYYEKLITGLRQKNPSAKIYLIPVGWVMNDLNEMIKKGQLSGFSSIFDFYSDELHLNGKGSMLLQTVFFATFAKKSPVGIRMSSVYPVNAEATRKIQESAWKIVSTHPYAGAATGTERIARPARCASGSATAGAAMCTIQGRLSSAGSRGAHIVVQAGHARLAVSSAARR